MILIAPDKFKGTYTSRQMCELMAEVVRRVRPDASVVLRPMSDGGEGFTELWMAAGVSGRLVQSSDYVGFGAFDRKVPLMDRSSYALGAAIRPGEPTVVAVGGTAVCDGGAGFLQGVGAKFYDRDGRLISEPLTPGTLHRVASADLSGLKDYRLRGIIDVRATLTGPGLSALDFARQKACEGEDLSGLKTALAHLHGVLGGESPYDGAGGGLGYALAAVAGAHCESGAQFAVSLIEPLLDSDEVSLVITGEGCVDRQTVEGGKLPDAVFRMCKERGIPTLMVYGRCELPEAERYPLMCQLNQLEICLRKLL